VLADGAPDALRGGRHWHVGDAERAERVFMTVGVAAIVPPSPTPLTPSGLVVLGTGLKSAPIAGSMSARGVP